VRNMADFLRAIEEEREKRTFDQTGRTVSPTGGFAGGAAIVQRG